jgi:hypothetical protein
LFIRLVKEHTMRRRSIIPALTVLASFSMPALAQESGGIALAPQIARGPTGLARPLPFVLPGVTAADVQASLKATDRSTLHQNMIARLRGDAGYLGGFSFGTPLSASVQPMQRVPVATDPGFGVPEGSGYGGDPGFLDGSGNGGGPGIPDASGNGGHRHHHGGWGGSKQIVVNRVDVTTFQGPVVVGNNNNVQQQTATGSGPIALQQVMAQPRTAEAAGAVNTIGPGGSIVQRAPGAVRSRPAHIVPPR